MFLSQGHLRGLTGLRRPLALLALLLWAVAAPADDHVELLNEEEREWLQSLSEPIIVGTEANYRPHAFIDENGEFSGVAADYLGIVEERLGIRFALHEYDTFAALMEAARRRHVDIVPFVIATDERRSFLNFTQPMFESWDRILVRSDRQGSLSIEDLEELKVGVVEGYTTQALIESEHPEIQLTLMPHEAEALRALSLGEVDALIVEIGVASHYIQVDGITNIRVAGEYGGVEYQSFGLRSDWPILNSIIGKALASITAEEREAIQRRWINIGGVDPGELERLWKQLIILVGVVGILVVGILFWNFSLRRLVARRTVELERELEERRRVEAVKERLAVAVEQSAEYVLIIDTSGQVEYANLSFLEANGVKSLRGRRLSSMTVGSARGKIIQALRDIRDSGVWRGQVDLERARKGAMKVSMTIAPIHDANGEIDGYVVTARDITNEEQLEARLRQREKLSALGTLANGIAHDFNNLLVPILGYADLIRMESSATVSSYLDAITEASERARDLVQRILIFGRGGAGEKVPLDLRFEVEDAITFVRSLLPASIEVEADLQECAAIMGDRTQIQQILLNLCTNAGDAMAEDGGVLTIKVEQYTQVEDAEQLQNDLGPGEYALLTVSDTGLGMDEITKSRVFDPYFTDKERGKGTGLGLAIVHGIVTGHGGVIHINSEPGLGTDVQIYFPTVAIEPTRTQPDAGPPMPRGDGQRIMVLDDDKLVLNTVAVMVQGLGYEVTEWTDPVEALDALRKAPDAYDAVLTDLTMDGLNGVEFAKRALDVSPDLPIAIMTGNPGALNGYPIRSIEKPIPLTELANCLAELLE